MAGLFICPYCGAATQVPPEFAGKSGPCARCGRVVSIPKDLDGSSSADSSRLQRPPRDRSMRTLAIVAVLLALILGGLVIGGRTLAAMLAAKIEQNQCAEKLRQIGVALGSYYDDYSAYPPIVTRGPKGRPWHSWRVLLLPYLGKDEEALYKEYHLEEPWNGPHNRELADLMPQAYGCPCDPGAFEQSQTSYLAIVDEATGDFATPPEIADANLSPQAKAAKARAKTRFLIVEVAESGVNWLEPRDLKLGASTGKAKNSAHGRFSYHVGGVNVLVRDGTTESMSEDRAKITFGPPAK